MERGNRPDRRGTSLQAPPRQSLYPRMGLEEPVRTSNARSLYRYGERGIWSRYIVAPDEDGGPLYPGITRGDVAVALFVPAWCACMLMGFLG